MWHPSEKEDQEKDQEVGTFCLGGMEVKEIEETARKPCRKGPYD